VYHHVIGEKQVVIFFQARLKIIQQGIELGKKPVRQVAPHPARYIEHAVDPATGEFLKQIKHQVAVSHAPEHVAVHAHGRGHTAEIEQVRGNA
jgi:hypothetical protein